MRQFPADFDDWVNLIGGILTVVAFIWVIGWQVWDAYFNERP